MMLCISSECNPRARAECTLLLLVGVSHSMEEFRNSKTPWTMVISGQSWDCSKFHYTLLAHAGASGIVEVVVW